MVRGAKDDENAREGKAARNLFRSASDSESSSEEDEVDNDDVDVAASSTTRIHRIRNVELEEQVQGGSIEHRLWPAASYLAEFILEQRSCRAELDTNRTAATPHADPAVAATLQAIQRLLQPTVDGGDDNGALSTPRLRIIELGAGIGLTGIALATHLTHSRIVLTDLESALDLLNKNVYRNIAALAPHTTLGVQTLAWGSESQIDAALASTTMTSDNANAQECNIPLLILASDCVYWEHLYEPLETTIAMLLQHSPKNSICLLAGMRRWKRDNHFYQHVLGKSSRRTASGRLECLMIDEQVTRTTPHVDNDTVSSAQPGEALGASEAKEQQCSTRQVMRIYAVQWKTNDK